MDKPKKGQHNITEMVVNDIHERSEVGKAKYGTELQSFNGRDALQDLYEELLDASQYIKQKIVEDDTHINKVKSVLWFIGTMKVYNEKGVKDITYELALTQVENLILQLWEDLKVVGS